VISSKEAAKNTSCFSGLFLQAKRGVTMVKTNLSKLDQDKVVQLVLAAVILVCGVAGLLDIVETGGAELTGLAVQSSYQPGACDRCGQNCADSCMGDNICHNNCMDGCGSVCISCPQEDTFPCGDMCCEPGERCQMGPDWVETCVLIDGSDGGMGPSDCDPMIDPTCSSPPPCDPMIDPNCVPPPEDYPPPEGDGSTGPEGPTGPDGGTGPGDGGDGGDGEDQCELDNMCGFQCCGDNERCVIGEDDGICAPMCNTEEIDCGVDCCRTEDQVCTMDETGNQQCVASCNRDGECADHEQMVECEDCRPRDDEDPCTMYVWINDQWENALKTVADRERINAQTDPWTCQNPVDIPGAGVPLGNGCGPDGIGNLVPEAPTTVCDYRFSGPCVRHDQCYQTCRPGGISQEICDNEFYEDLLRECDTYETAGSYCHNRCTEDAYAYQQAVATGASMFDAFTGSQRAKCQCCSTEPGPLDMDQ